MQHKNNALSHYFWSAVNEDTDHNEGYIFTLKILASIGYNDAYTVLRKHLGESYVSVKNDAEAETEISMMDIEIGSKDLNTDFVTIPNVTTEYIPLLYEFEADEEGVVEVEYVNSFPSEEKSLIGSRIMSSDEEEEVNSGEDVCCFAYNYGGPELENLEGWDRLGLLQDPWAEERHLYFDMLTSSNLKLEEIDSNLNMVIIASGIGIYTLTPDKKGYGYTKLQLSSKGLRNVDILKFYPYLQYVDLANNNIEDPSALWEIDHLIVLDLSKNKLSDDSIGQPKRIWFLTYLNLSHNNFSRIPDFSNCWAIKHFDLSHNKIKTIEVVYNLKYLSYLNLSNNDLEVIENLDNKLLREINFSYNHIKYWRYPGPKAIHSLETINISHNQLPTLTIFAEMYNLTTLDISYNKISAMSEFDTLKTLPVMKDLKIAGNQLNIIIPDPKRLIAYLVPSIKALDSAKISPMEKVSSISLYGNNSLQQLICQHSLFLYFRHTMNPTVGWERLKDTGHHPALVVLIGDIGSSRKKIIDLVQKMNPHICKEVKMITSRPPAKDEIKNSRMKYVTLKKFNNIEKKGGFIVVERKLGHKCGIAVNELEDKHRVLLVFLGMTAALELLWKGYNPTLIMMLPNKEEVLQESCPYWFQTTDVYKPKFKVTVGGKKKSKELRDAQRNRQKDDEHNASNIGSFSNDEKRKSPVMKRKKKSKLKRCNRMLTSIYNKSRKWIHRRYSEDIGKEITLLDDAYGRMLTAGPRGKIKKEWCKILPTDRNNIKLQLSSELFSSFKEISDENEYWRFVQNIFRNQFIYRDMHKRNPGLFQLFISSDDLKKAALTLLEVVKCLYEKLEASKKVKTLNMRDDPNYESMVYEPVMELINEIIKYDLPLDSVI